MKRHWSRFPPPAPCPLSRGSSLREAGCRPRAEPLPRGRLRLPPRGRAAPDAAGGEPGASLAPRGSPAASVGGDGEAEPRRGSVLCPGGAGRRPPAARRRPAGGTRCRGGEAARGRCRAEGRSAGQSPRRPAPCPPRKEPGAAGAARPPPRGTLAGRAGPLLARRPSWGARRTRAVLLPQAAPRPPPPPVTFLYGHVFFYACWGPPSPGPLRDPRASERRRAPGPPSLPTLLSRAESGGRRRGRGGPGPSLGAALLAPVIALPSAGRWEEDAAMAQGRAPQGPGGRFSALLRWRWRRSSASPRATLSSRPAALACGPGPGRAAPGRGAARKPAGAATGSPGSRGRRGGQDAAAAGTAVFARAAGPRRSASLLPRGDPPRPPALLRSFGFVSGEITLTCRAKHRNRILETETWLWAFVDLFPPRLADRVWEIVFPAPLAPRPVRVHVPAWVRVPVQVPMRVPVPAPRIRLLLTLLCWATAARSPGAAAQPPPLSITLLGVPAEPPRPGDNVTVSCKALSGLPELTLLYWLGNGSFVETLYPDGAVREGDVQEEPRGRGATLRRDLHIGSFGARELHTNFTCVALSPGGFSARQMRWAPAQGPGLG
ncbi:interleukin-18-binding protein [Rhea pennata]|uniref:interleukin-18-binding protein n=1 Tax=Rhea pennata TaxID=8795 RepID=UPI002E263198